MAELKRDCFYGGLPKQLNVVMAYLKVVPQVRTYSDYLRPPEKLRKRFPWSCPGAQRTQTPNNPPKPRATSFSPLRKLKGNQPIPKILAVHLAHLEEEDAGSDKDEESDDPSGIEEVTKGFMAYLARAVKDAQTRGKSLLSL